MMNLSHLRRALWLAPAALTLVGCSGTAPRALHSVSLSVTTRSASGAPLPTGSGVRGAVQVGSGPNSLTISQAQVVLARIELSTTGTCATTGESDDCDELHIGPTLVNLPVDGTTQAMLVDAVVPAGTYDGLHVAIDAVHPDDDEPGGSTFLTAHPDFKGISVKVTGVFTDASGQTHNFTFTSETDAEIEARFEPPVTVASDTKNFTVAVDLGSWFKDASGAVLDPTNAANAEAIERNIRQSIRAFVDNDRDGVDDHQEEGHRP